jgi:hypothetical protein
MRNRIQILIHILIRIKVKSGIWIGINDKRGIRIRIKVMRILNPVPPWHRIEGFWLVPPQAEK